MTAKNKIKIQKINNIDPDMVIKLLPGEVNCQSGLSPDGMQSLYINLSLRLPDSSNVIDWIRSSYTTEGLISYLLNVKIENGLNVYRWGGVVTEDWYLIKCNKEVEQDINKLDYYYVIHGSVIYEVVKVKADDLIKMYAVK